MRGIETGESKGAPTAEVTWEVRGKRLVIRHRGVAQKAARAVGFALATLDGAEVDYVVHYTSGSTLILPGAYTTDGDTLTIGFSLTGDRPAECESGPDRVL
jgi:hypothetical protein